MKTKVVPVSLPVITPEIAEQFWGCNLIDFDTRTPSGWGWTQDAVDFACLISAAPTPEQDWQHRAEAADARAAELEASALSGYEDGWHTLRAERDELKARLAAVLGLPRFNVTKHGDPQMGGGYGSYRIKAVPKSQWINGCTFVRADELEALLKQC